MHPIAHVLATTQSPAVVFSLYIPPPYLPDVVSQLQSMNTDDSTKSELLAVSLIAPPCSEVDIQFSNKQLYTYTSKQESIVV